MEAAGRTGSDGSGPGDWQHGSQQGRRAGPGMDGCRGGAEGLGSRWDAWVEQSEGSRGRWDGFPGCLNNPREMLSLPGNLKKMQLCQGEGL